MFECCGEIDVFALCIYRNARPTRGSYYWATLAAVGYYGGGPSQDIGPRELPVGPRLA